MPHVGASALAVLAKIERRIVSNILERSADVFSTERASEGVYGELNFKKGDDACTTAMHSAAFQGDGHCSVPPPGLGSRGLATRVLNPFPPSAYRSCAFFILILISLTAAGPAFEIEIAAAIAPQATGIRWPVLQP